MAGEVQNSALVPLLNICIEFKAKCLETATSQSTLTLPAMLGRPYRTTRFDRQKIDICKTNGKAENRKE